MTRCPGCHGLFSSLLGLDAHRRHPHAAAGCRYGDGERRNAYRPGWLTRREVLPYPGR